MCFEILDLWIESLSAFISKSELFLKDNLSYMLINLLKIDAIKIY